MIPAIPDKLIKAIENDSLVLFIGTGLSIPLGLPSWSTLIEELINEVANKEKPSLKSLLAPYQDNILDTFEVLEKLEPYRATVFDFLEKRLKDDIDFSTKDLTIQKKIWQVSKQVITTNYDKAIEKANNIEAFAHDNANNIRKLGNLTCYVLKIHGDINDSAKCILFKSDYNTLYDDKSAAIFQLKSTFANKTILFIGFGMTDPYVKYVANYVNEIFDGLNGKHYLIHTQYSDFTKEGIEILNINTWNDLGLMLDALLAIKIPESMTRVSIDATETSKIDSPINHNTLNDYPKPINSLFTGREMEKEIFRNALISEGLFAIEGLGGIGKTEFVTKCIEEFIEDKERIIWLDGNENSTFEVFVESCGYGEVLRGEKKSQQSIFSGFKDLIKRDKRIIFWDNYQSIKDTKFLSFVDFSQRLLQDCNIVFLSKEEVYINNETIFTIPIEGLKEEALEYSKKLRDSQGRFSKISDEELTILCKRTMGHPLAIKLCLPLLIKGFNVEDIFSNLGDYQGVREVENLTRRLFKEVYDHTNDKEKELLLKFSVFKHKIPKEAIELLYAERDLAAILSGLIDKFLITVENGFYESHSLIRELSSNLLLDKVSANAIAAKYYISKRTNELTPGLEEKIYYHLAKSNQNELIAKEIEDKGRNYILLGQLGLVNEVIDVLKRAGINKEIFNIFYGDIAEVYGKWEESRNFYELAVNQNEDKRVKAEGIIKQGEMIYRFGKVKESLPHFEEAYSYCKENNFRREEARAVNDIGLVYNMFGNINFAEEKYLEALSIRKEEGDLEGMAISLLNIGALLKDRGKYQDSLIKLNESFTIYTQIGNKNGIALCGGHIANCLMAMGRIDDAFDYDVKALNINKEIGNKKGIADILNGIGVIFSKKGNFNEAQKKYEESQEINTEIGDKIGLATSLHNIAAVFNDQKQYKKALEKFKECIALIEDIGYIKLKANALSHMSNTYRDTKLFPEALRCLTEALDINLEIGAEGNATTDCLNIGALYLRNFGNHTKALLYFFQSIAINNKLKLNNDSVKPWIKEIREKKLGREKFRSVAHQIYEQMNEDLKAYIPINELCKEGTKLKPPISRNSPCTCGSGKQYKRCHGKDK